MKILIKCLLLIVLSNSAMAADLGVMGDTYPIQEENFGDVLKQRATQLVLGEKWVALQKQWRDRAQLYRDRPTPARSFKTAKESVSFLHSPSIILEHDIRSAEGHIIARSGTIINPLMHMTFSETLIFIDGDDVRQVKWAVKREHYYFKSKIILVSGSITHAEKQFKHPIYFDQGASIASKLCLEFVPAVVQQEGLMLRVKEYAL